MLKLSLKMTMRDWRAGELRLLLAALVVSIAALSAVGFFTERFRGGMQRDAKQQLAADLLVTSDADLQPAWRSAATALGLRTATTTSLVSMASAGEGDAALAHLVSVKAVSPEYPLLGSVTLQVPTSGTGPATATASAKGIPAPGAAWIDPSLASQLDLAPGSVLRLGDARFTVTHLIALEPDRRYSPVNLSPRVMIAADDLPATGLLAPGTRATRALLLAGLEAPLASYAQHLQDQLTASTTSNVRIQTAKNSSADMAETLRRSSSFLSLVSLLTALLAAVAIAMAARRYMLRHIDTCAMLACLGLRQGQILRLHLMTFLLLGLGAGVIGVLTGYVSHVILLHWLRALLPPFLPAATWTPALQGMAAALILLAGFALPPLLQLRNVSPVSLLRREPQPPRGATLAATALGAAAFSGLLLWQAGDVKMGVVGVAMLLACLLFAACAWAGLYGLGRLRNASARPEWRFAITALQRQPGATVAQTVSLALGLCALLLLTVVRGDLLAAWRSAVPADAPNHYIAHVQPDQERDVSARLQPYGKPVLLPTMRGRLLTVNGKPATDVSAKKPPALDVADFDLSTAATLPADSTIIAGKWLAPASTQPEVSVGEGAAETFGIKVGDMLAFDMGGLPMTASVTSLRKVNWRARAASFDFLLNAAAARELPRTYSSSVYIPQRDRKAADLLVRDYPNIILFDFDFLIQQMQGMVAQVSVAVEFLFMFTLASGLLVLYAALAGSQDARIRQAALLRALGATRRQLSRTQWMEHALTGTLAGLLAAAGATLASWALARFVFELPWNWSPQLLLAGLLSGLACAIGGGWLGLRHVLNQSPLHTLRQA